MPLSLQCILKFCFWKRFFWAYLFLSWFGNDVYKSLKLIPDIGIGIPFLHLKDLARMPYIFPYTPFIYNNSEESGRSTPNDLINSIFLAVFECHFHLFDKDLLLFITIWREKLLVYCKCRILWLFLEMKMQRWEKGE